MTKAFIPPQNPHMKSRFTLIAALLLTPMAASAAEPSQQTWRISNEVMVVSISARDAGAVCSLVYDGQEFVNDHDHGRQLQVAWFYNDLGEAYNPTEAGADKDGVGPRSTSQLVSVQADGHILQTVNHPAHWRHTSLPEEHRKNTALVSKDTLTKKLTLGFNGDPHVLVFDTTVAISPELTGPPMNSMRIEAPTLYSHPHLGRHQLFDLASGELKEVPSRALNFDQMNEVIRHVTRHDVAPILSSRDGRHAVAFFTPQRGNFWAYCTHDVPSKDPTNACGKMTAFFKHAVAAGQSHSYRTFIVVGDLATVQASLRKLATHGTETPPSQGKP
jgi:hypothetical protein